MEKDFIIYEVNKSNILKMCLLMFLFGIVGTLFLLFPTFFVSSIYRNILIIKLIGILGVITSVIFLIGHITLFGSSYGFKILKEGIINKSNLTNCGIIYFKDIIKIQTKNLKKNNFILIFVKNEHEYLKRVKNPLLKINLMIYKRSYNTPFIIEIKNLNCTIQQLEQDLKKARIKIQN